MRMKDMGNLLKTLPLFMMIRFMIQDSHRPVDLFDKDQTDHLVGESHFA